MQRKDPGGNKNNPYAQMIDIETSIKSRKMLTAQLAIKQ